MSNINDPVVPPAVESVSWNPALRPADNENLDATKSDTLALHTKEGMIEESTALPDLSPVPETTETPSAIEVPTEERLEKDDTPEAQEPAISEEVHSKPNVNATEDNVVPSTIVDEDPLADAVAGHTRSDEPPSEAATPAGEQLGQEDKAEESQADRTLEEPSLQPTENEVAHNWGFEDDNDGDSTAWMKGAEEDNLLPPETAPAAPDLAPSDNKGEEPQTHRTREETSPAEHDVAQNGALKEGNIEDNTTWMKETEEGDKGVATANVDVDGTAQAFWESTGDDSDNAGEENFFNQLKTQTKPIYVPPEAESRFEEGVPLLEDKAETPVQTTANVESQIDQMFEDEEDEGAGFFSSVQKQAVEDAQRPSHITRKSTSQVIGTVDFIPDSPNVDVPATSQTADFESLAAPENGVKKVSSEEDLAARWQAELDDDDDLLLEDEAANVPSTAEEQVPQISNGVTNQIEPSGLSSPFETPQSSTKPQARTTIYTPHQPSTSDLLQGLPLQGTVATSGAAPTPSYFSAQPQSQPQPAARAESFVDKKEGYKSPYDLPGDLARPRRAVATYKPVVSQPGSMPPPPTRSSSVPVPPPPSSMMPAPSALPTPPASAALPVATSPPPPKNFYEELPLPQRPRHASSGRYTPDPTASSAGTSQLPYPASPYAGVPPPPTQAAAPPSSNDTYIRPQLQQPGCLDPYATTHLAPTVPSAPSAASRYSPKPPGLPTGTKPPPSPRYSPAPPPTSAPPGRNRYVSQSQSVSSPGTNLPFQPRTSSPLAYHEKHASASQLQANGGPSLDPAASFSPPTRSQLRQSIDQGSVTALNLSDSVVDAAPIEAEPAQSISQHVNQQQTPPPRNPYAPSEQKTSPPRNPYAPSEQQASPSRHPYAPQDYINEFSRRVAPVASVPPVPATGVQYASPSDPALAPPRRSQTQSPGRQLSGPQTLSIPSLDPHQRPASVHGSSSPTKIINPYTVPQPPAHNRLVSQPLNFIAPTDGQQLDPLERWKGAPIFKFGFGGAVTSCFPKHIPRYAAGQVAPMIKPAPGEVKLSQLNEWVPASESIVRHPGPLKAKSKKKDLVAWLSSKIAAFENEGLPETAQLDPVSYKRYEERILLWKIVRVLVEHDGVPEGSADIQKAVRNVIFPHLQTSEAEPVYGNGYATSTGFKPIDAPSQPDAADSRSVESLRNNLLAGDREKAVWGAVDGRLWGHAMIIASTLDKAVWKQVVQEFVRREVRSAQGNTESLAALYEIFAGNIEESVDELVPPSARAGLQMVSKVNGQGPAKNALDGLDSWQDTLGLVLSNRSPEDHQALVALGRLLSSYGRTEAAHICFIFSRAPVFGGADDPQANIVLLGADHQRFPGSLLDEDNILLTEAYEYATSVLANSPTATLPHFQAFKLLHAKSLADRGRKSDAQQYCDSIAAALKANTRPSGYHHQLLFTEVDELSARLRQTTSDGTSSWISKPSMEKVSGSMWAKFNSFVAGEDSDVASTGSGKAAEADIGPFAKVTGTPTVSRSPSVSDLYGSYPVAGAQPIPAGVPSRYHPGNQYAPNSSPEQYRGRSSLDSQRSPSYSFGQRRGSQEPSTPVDTNPYQAGSLYSPPQAMVYHSTPPQSSYIPLAPVEEDMVPPTQPEPVPTASSMSTPYYQPSMQPMQAPDVFGQSFGNHETVSQSESFGYMPPSSSFSYEPPSNEADQTSAPDDVEDSTVEEPPKKKSFMDDEDEDDLAARAAAIQKAEKERKDREADEAFRKAAEADAKRPVQTTKKSWFGGWFGGKKEEDKSNAGGGPIRAKLGEANSFYYDTELKKWVNKKDPNSATPTRGTPPPPRASAPPSRSASASSVPAINGPPMAAGPDSRPPSVAGGPPPHGSSPSLSSPGAPPPADGTIPRSVSTGAAVPTPPGGSTGPAPPRPATSLSHATSIDDLIGAPQARKGPAAKGRKKGRYVDVMAK